MKKIQITVPKLHCVKKNDFLNKDRIYLVMIITTTKADGSGNPKVVFSGLSGISEFRKNDIKVFDLGTRWAFNVNDDEIFNISFGVYEQDRGDVYNQYLRDITAIVETNGMNYNDMITELWNAVKDKVVNLNLVSLLLLLPEVGLKILKDFRKDDLIGKRTISFQANDPNMYFTPEFDLKDAESFYKIQIKLNEI
ncbi:hypothetical protein [Chryseobacterium sp. C3]|uniref:hypothetical protein n=1 Tax=Chryseobacterium sp. C3 TaxID=2761532 RepID=UPI0016298E85|nr:hypothetical protein [Chryseobacterium sp. C3]